MSQPPRFPLFSRFGIELEYMIVDARTLVVLPLADRLIQRVTGNVNGDVTRGGLAWSNELALHVIELKTGRPARSLEPLADQFQAEVAYIHSLLADEGAVLLPTAMHPWMDPRRESRLWPHDCAEIYQAFHRIFNCRGHGWTNLQSAHLNLPFANDDEFARLHTAIRLVLPLLPALAASSPLVAGRRARFLDMRLETYRKNCACIPSVTAAVVPEPVTSRKEYQDRILRRIYRDLAPFDPDGTLQHEWANARGAIARFERNTIEVRVLDMQECPAADLAIVQFLTTVLQRLTDGSLSGTPEQLKPRTRVLADVLQRTTRVTGAARVDSYAVLKALGASPGRDWTARDLWRHLLEVAAPAKAPWRSWIERILSEGTLSERILEATGSRPSRERLRSVYRQLAGCLRTGTPFQTAPSGKA